MPLKTIKYLILIVIMLMSLDMSAFSQCSCMGGAAVGGLTPVGGTVNVGVLRKDYFRAAAFYRYSRGDTYYRNDSPAETGLVDSYHIHYTGLLVGYGLSNKLTLEAELGGFPEKYQDFKYFSLSSGGLSHILVSGKYNLYYDFRKEFEISAGAGLRAPLVTHEENLPQHILPSTGAYGAVFQLFIHKGFEQQGIRLILMHRTDINAENNLDYQYGTGFYTSLYLTKNIIDRLSGIVEIRNEFRLKDKYLGETYEDSGGNIFIISPQINYTIKDFNISALLDYPFYKNYNGYQLANDFSIAFNITWQTELF